MRIKEVIVHGRKRWRVAWMVNGSQVRRFFSSLDEAERQLADLQREKQELGEALFDWPAEIKVRILTAMRRLEEHGGSIEEAVDLWIKQRQARPTLQAPTVGQVLASMLDAKAAAGARPRYLQQIAWSLKKFTEEFGARKTDEIKPEELERWLHRLQVKPVTRRGYLTDVRTLFSFARKKGWVVHNPAEGVERPRIDEGPVSIFTVQECRSLLEAAAEHSPAVLGYLAIGMFAGLRPSEIDRLRWDKVQTDWIEVEATKVRSRRRRLVTIAPALRLFLDAAVKQGEWVRPLNFVRLWRRAIKRSGVTWRADGLRHSFASYHLAMHRDAARTAFELGHRNTEMLFAHYRERVTPAQAAEFWAISPKQAIPQPGQAG